MRQFEYKEAIWLASRDGEFEAWLRQYGKAGWELVGVQYAKMGLTEGVYGQHCVFKRERGWQEEEKARFEDYFWFMPGVIR